MSKFDEENLDKELEVAATKVRWDMGSNPEKFGEEVESVVEDNTKEEAQEKRKQAEMLDVERRQRSQK